MKKISKEIDAMLEKKKAEEPYGRWLTIYRQDHDEWGLRCNDTEGCLSWAKATMQIVLEMDGFTDWNVLGGGPEVENKYELLPNPGVYGDKSKPLKEETMFKEKVFNKNNWEMLKDSFSGAVAEVEKYKYR